MGLPEKSPNPSHLSLRQSLNRIKTRDVQDVSSIAAAVTAAIEVGDILVEQAPPLAPWLSNFHLSLTETDFRGIPKGIIQVGQPAQNANLDRWDGENVRTMTLAKLHLEGNYGQPLADGCRQAFEVQNYWLEEGANGAFLDPDFMNGSFALQKLLGQEMLQFDFGYQEWRDAVLVHCIDQGLNIRKLLEMTNGFDFTDSLDTVWSDDNGSVVTAKLQTLAELRNSESKFYRAREIIWRGLLDGKTTAEVRELKPIRSDRPTKNRANAGALRAVEISLKA